MKDKICIVSRIVQDLGLKQVRTTYNSDKNWDKAYYNEASKLLRYINMDNMKKVKCWLESRYENKQLIIAIKPHFNMGILINFIQAINTI